MDKESSWNSKDSDKVEGKLVKIYHFLKEKKVQRYLLIIQYCLILLIFVYLLSFAGKVDFSNLDYLLILASSLSVIMLRVISIYRLHILLHKLKNVSFRTIWKIQSWALLFGLFTPVKAGESIIVWSLGKGRDEKIKIASLFTISKLLDGIVYIPFGLVFALVYHRYLKVVLGILFLFVVLLIVYARINSILKLESRELRRISVYALTLASLFLQAAGLYLILLSQDIKIPLFTTTIIWSIASIVAMLSTLPGGIGAREAGISFLLSNFAGIDLNLAVSTSLLHGFVVYSTTTLFAVGSKIILKEKRIS